MIGEPPFAVLMITIGLGFIFRAAAGAIWGNDPKSISSPLTGGVLRIGELTVGYENLAVIAGTAVLCAGALPVLPVHPSRYRHAGHVAEPARSLLYRHTGQTDFQYRLALSCAIAAAAGILVAPVSLIDPRSVSLA